MTLNVALLGTGRIAEYGYIPAISKIDDVNIISVLSRSDTKALNLPSSTQYQGFMLKLMTYLQIITLMQ